DSTQHARGFFASPGRLPLLAHEACAIRSLGFILVVRPAAQACVLDRRLATTRHGMHVVILEQSRLIAALSSGAHERALLSVALMDGASDFGRDVTRVLRA